jgi:transcriptional regulator with XRE-family HTH domain
MAKQLKISIPAFSKIETGITDLTLSRLKQIAELFGLTIIQLIMQGEESELKYSSELLAVQERLHQREAEVTALQKKVIDLFEELRSRASA